MKYIFFFCSLLLATISQAQDNKPYEMQVHGVKVIVVPSGNDIVQIDLVVKGGVQNYTADKAGIEKLAFTALTECGTLHHSKNSFKNKLDEIDARIFGHTAKDASHFQLNCIKGDFETVWPLYVEALTAPKFDVKEFNRIKENAINDLRAEESDPDASLRKMALQTAFKGMDYSKSTGGTIENLKKFTPQLTKEYFKSILTRSRIFMVVVADLFKEELQKKLENLFAAIPQGKPFELKRAAYVPKANSFTPRKKDNATNYIMGISSAPSANSKDYLPGTLASGLFYDKMFLEVRTNHALSYAPLAYMTTGTTPYTVMQVTTKDPDKYIAVARALVDKIKKEGFPADDVKNMKSTYATYQYYENETNESLCWMVVTAEVEQGNWHKAFSLKEDLQPITPTEVNQVFNKYVGKFTWVYQGDPTQVTPLLYTQQQTPAMPKEKKAF